MVVYYVLLLFAGQLGLEHNLYKFGNVPAAVYSDMNGYGHFLPRVRTFQAYWGAASLLLLVLALLFWSRGTASSWRERLAAAKERFGGPTIGVAGAGAAGVRRARRLHLLQHQRPQPLRDDRRPAGAAGRVREALQADGGRAAAEDQRGDAGRRPVSARAAGADEGPLRAREQVRPAGRPAAAGVRPGRQARRPPARHRRAEPAREGRRRARRPDLPARPAAAAGREDRRSPSTSSCRPAASPTKARTPQWSTTARFVNGRDDAAADRLPGSRRARARPGPQEVRPRAQGADARPRRSGRAGSERAAGRRRLHRLRGDGVDRARPDRDLARLPAARVDRERAALLPLQDGCADPQLLRLPVGALRGEEGRLGGTFGQRRDRDLLPAGARVQPRLR